MISIINTAICLASITTAQAIDGTNTTASISQESGLRVIEGTYLRLLTDLPPSQEIDELPQVFDLAVPHWCKHFSFSSNRLNHWKITGYLIQSRERFKTADLLPDDLPPFLNGYQRGDKMWIYAQPSAYYTRHLLLHEGTHAFMFNHLQGGGAVWYSEGVAEYLGTHRWHQGKLQMGYMPETKAQVPYWGRIRIVKNDLINHRGKSLTEVMNYVNGSFGRNEPYAWSWAANTFLSSHPDFSKRYQMLKKHVRLGTDEFNQRFAFMFRRDRQKLKTAWQLFVFNLGYGYDIAADRVHYQRVAPWKTNTTPIAVDSKLGWQSSGFALQAGSKYRLVAKGKFRIRKSDPDWYSEAGGITLRYHSGNPLGILMAAVENEKSMKLSGLVRPTKIGLQRTFVPREDGTLFLRINEASRELHDNEGTLFVMVQKVESNSPN